MVDSRPVERIPGGVGIYTGRFFSRPVKRFTTLANFG